MEGLDDKIKRFLEIGDGSGYGSGDGYGDGSGSGDGSGYGSGDGYGSGSGYGSGYGDGSGVAVFNGDKVWMVDGVPTLIRSVYRGYAKCAVLRYDLTLKACYVAKEGCCFAHGDTLRDAVRDARGKYLGRMPVEERIRLFAEEYPDASCVVKGTELYRWHGILTGSCRMGRDEWCRAHGMDPETTSLTVKRFCALTANSYGGEVIRQLAARFGIIV